jgi:antitoxin component YwqK of YwqJK toxin-antitoxin module
MLRATKWVSSLTIGLALACEASALRAQQVSNPADEATSQDGASAKSRPVDYVVELPGEEDSDLYDASDDTAQPLEDTYTADSPSGEKETELIKERFPNGTIQIERQVTQDPQGNYINDGSWKTWDQRGNLVAQGQYDAGERTGTWVRWYRTVTEANILSQAPYKQFAGPFISQATFKNDKLDGLWTIYDGKMRKISQWTFTDGKRHGPSTWWYPNGKKMREALFKDGDMDGLYIESAPDGSVSARETYQEGRKLAVKTSHHKGGAKKSQGVYLFAKDIEHSPDDWWNCKLITTVKSGKDEKHGPWVSWFATGQKQIEGRYEHDLQVGEFTWWHSNGQRALQGSFNKGKQDGTWTWWHSNGQKSIEGEYVHGNPTGRWTWWKEDGRVVQSADLSHSEGVVIDTPRELDPPAAPRTSRPAQRQPVKR